MTARRGFWYIAVGVIVFLSVLTPLEAAVIAGAVAFVLLELHVAWRRIDELSEMMTEETRQREWRERP